MWKAPLRGFFLVLVVAGVAILSLALWARYTVYDEDQFVSVVGGLSTDPAIQHVAVTRLMAEIDTQVATQTTAQGLSPTVAITYQMFRPQIEQGIITALNSPAYKPYWVQALRELHTPLTALLKGNDTPNLKQTGNQVQVNLYPAYELAQQNFGPQVTALLAQVNLSPDNLWFTVLEGDQLAQVQRYVRLFNRTLALGIILSVLSAIGYVLLSNRKLRAMAWLLLAIGLGLLIQRFALQYGKEQLTEALQDPNERNAAQVFYNTLVGDLRHFELYALIVAIGVAVAIMLVDYFMVQKKLQEIDAAA
ncbi:MAG TPA: hypothetical protein VFP05_12850 [Thermomicrobiales bacterium]|nr:hypothetical protein [Thermomicrobiales bacterium]